MDDVSAVILAAGAGTRLKQSLPKPLISLMGKPLFLWVVQTAEQLGIQDIVVVIHPSTHTLFQKHAPMFRGRYVYQEELTGTADAACIGMQHAQHDKVLVLGGDTPCIPAVTLRRMLEMHRVILGFYTERYDGYGIIEVSGNKAFSIQENSIQKGIANAGSYVVSRQWALKTLPCIGPKGEKNERWITEMVAIAARENHPFDIIVHDISWQCEGINTVEQWVFLEQCVQKYYAQLFISESVYLDQPDSICLSADMSIASGVRIGRGCVFKGQVRIASDTIIEPYCIIEDASIGAHVTIASFTSIEKSTIGDYCLIGPYAHVLSSTCEKNVEIGNYVEVKRSHLGYLTKAKHLSYIGDTTTRACVNIGAGTITCNYDGWEKHSTVIEEGAFIGAHATLIAPVTVGAYAVIAAGSVVNTKVPASMLTIGRNRCVSMEHPLCSTLEVRHKTLLENK